MKLPHWLLSILIVASFSQSAAAIDTAEEYYRSRFESLMGSTDAVVSYYDNRALILQHGVNSFQAVFIAVEDQKTHEICGFGARFSDEYAIGTAGYKLKTQYYCSEQFKPYEGKFQLKQGCRCDVWLKKVCMSEICSTSPAAGVGNLKITSGEVSKLMSLPTTLDVVIQWLPTIGT